MGVAVGIRVGLGVAVGLLVGVGLGVGVRVGKGVTVGVGTDVAVGMAARVACMPAFIVASMSRVGAGVGVDTSVAVGCSSRVRAATVAGIFGVAVTRIGPGGDVGAASWQPTAKANINTAISKNPVFRRVRQQRRSGTGLSVALWARRLIPADLVALIYRAATASPAMPISFSNPSGSLTAKSASILRSISMPASFRPCMNWL